MLFILTQVRAQAAKLARLPARIKIIFQLEFFGGAFLR
jgi:hypothetical protein